MHETAHKSPQPSKQRENEIHIHTLPGKTEQFNKQAMTLAREPKQSVGRSVGRSVMPAHKSGATLERNAKVPLKCQFYDVFLRVGVTEYRNLQCSSTPGRAGTDPVPVSPVP